MPADSAREFYRSARDEMLTRMRIRDNILIVYLGAVSTLFAIAINSAHPEILFCIPYLALGAGLLVCQHYCVMGHLAHFCVTEIANVLEKQNAHAPQWDRSATFHELTSWSIQVRCISHMILLCLPGVMALMMNSKHVLDSPFPFGQLWWFSLLCILATLVLLAVTHWRRYRLYHSKDWPWVDDEEQLSNKTMDSDEE